MSRNLLVVGDEKVDCPVCNLVRGEKAWLELQGPSHWPTEDKRLYCANCGRTYESVRWFFDYFVTRTVPKIEAEMQAADIVYDREAEERQEVWKWDREKQVKEAVEAGTWHPTLSPNHLPRRRLRRSLLS